MDKDRDAAEVLANAHQAKIARQSSQGSSSSPADSPSHNQARSLDTGGLLLSSDGHLDANSLSARSSDSHYSDLSCPGLDVPLSVSVDEVEKPMHLLLVEEAEQAERDRKRAEEAARKLQEEKERVELERVAREEAARQLEKSRPAQRPVTQRETEAAILLTNAQRGRSLRQAQPSLRGAPAAASCAPHAAAAAAAGQDAAEEKDAVERQKEKEEPTEEEKAAEEMQKEKEEPADEEQAAVERQKEKEEEQAAAEKEEAEKEKDAEEEKQEEEGKENERDPVVRAASSSSGSTSSPFTPAEAAAVPVVKRKQLSGKDQQAAALLGLAAQGRALREQVAVAQ